MPDFERLYHILFNAMTDALRKLEAGEPLEAARLLMEAQRRTEELYICLLYTSRRSMQTCPRKCTP